MTIACPSCGSKCWSGAAAAGVTKRVRCRECGTNLSIEGESDASASAASRSATVVALSRTDARSLDTRTLRLLEDATTELRDQGDRLVAVGNATRNAVRSWTEIRAASLSPFHASSSEGNEYTLELGGERVVFRGAPTHPQAQRLWTMLTGLWRTVESTPL